MGKLKAPELNAYRYGTLTAAEFAPSKNYPDQPEVKLTGNWEGEGDGYWYANWKTVTALAAAGILTQLSGDGKMFQPMPGTRFCVYRQKGEGDAHDWFVVVYDGASAIVTLQPAPVPFKPQAAPAPAAAAPPPVGPQAPPPPQREGPASGNPPPQLSGAASAPTPPPQQSDADRQSATTAHHRRMLSEVDAMYGLCLVVAAYRQVQFFEVPARELDVSGLQAGAATIMIRLEKAGYDPKTDRRPAYVKRLRRLEHSLFPDSCPAVPEDVKGNGVGQAKPRKEAQVPAHVSTIPAAESKAGESADGDDLEEDDLPF